MTDLVVCSAGHHPGHSSQHPVVGQQQRAGRAEGQRLLWARPQLLDLRGVALAVAAVRVIAFPVAVTGLRTLAVLSDVVAVSLAVALAEPGGCLGAESRAQPVAVSQPFSVAQPLAIAIAQLLTRCGAP